MSPLPVSPRRLAPLAFVATIVSLAVVSYFLWRAEHRQAEALRQASYAKGRQDENKAIATAKGAIPPGESKASSSDAGGETKPAPTAEPTADSIATSTSDHKLVLAVAALLSVIFTVFGFVILLGNYPDDSKKWATGILGTILGFWLGVPKS
jgi:hypothetical protein